MDITPLLPYLRSTSGIALSCRGFAWRVKSNGFPIKTSKGGLCLDNFSFYKLLEYPELDDWTISEFEDAIKTDNRDRLLLLLDRGANIEAKDIFGSTALMYAAWNGKVEYLKLLLQNKANVEAKDHNKNTASFLSVMYGKTECLQLLLEHKIDIEAKNKYGGTALTMATLQGRVDCLKILLRSGAKVDPGLRELYPQYSDLWPDSTL